jgi:hypothetical protein
MEMQGPSMGEAAVLGAGWKRPTSFFGLARNNTQHPSAVAHPINAHSPNNINDTASATASTPPSYIHSRNCDNRERPGPRFL